MARTGGLSHSSKTNKDKVKQESLTIYRGGKAVDTVVQHHEIGDAVHFLKMFGVTRKQAVSNLMAGSIQILGLDEIKRQYEGDWQAIEHKVMKNIESFFSRKLAKGDLYTPLGKDRFALLFANSSKAEAQVKAQKITSDLISHLFGQVPGADLISIEALVFDEDSFDDLGPIRSLSELVEAFNQAVSKNKKKESQTFKHARKEIELKFRVCINRNDNIVSMNDCLLYRTIDDMPAIIENEDPLRLGTPQLRAELDIEALRLLKPYLQNLSDVKDKPYFLLDVQYETLANRSTRQKYAQALKRLPEFTTKYLILNITGLVKDTPQSRFQQILSFLNPLVLGYYFEISLPWNEFDKIKGLPVLGFTLSDVTIAKQDVLAHFVSEAGAQDKAVFLRSITDDSVAKIAFNLNIDNISGPAIAAIQDNPTKPFALPS